MNCYEYPERLGVDRWMVMIGARQITEGPCCVIDAGTALTIDMIHGNGKHLGGLIVPGLSLMFGCLESGTAIPGYAEQLSDNNLGCSTNTAIQLGCLRALAGVVEKTLHDTGLVDPKVLLTGGDATLLASVVNYPLTIVPDLVLQGLLQFTDTD
jgi:type III pantothenate kinase